MNSNVIFVMVVGLFIGWASTKVGLLLGDWTFAVGYLVGLGVMGVAVLMRRGN